MSNLEKASRLLQDFVFENGADVDMYYAAKDLLVADLLMPDVQIIRTVEELEALDPNTALIAHDGWMRLAGFMQDNPPLANTYLPAVVIATGDQVRAAREAMEEEHG